MRRWIGASVKVVLLTTTIVMAGTGVAHAAPTGGTLPQAAGNTDVLGQVAEALGVEANVV